MCVGDCQFQKSFIAYSINCFISKQFIIITTGTAPSLSGVATTKVRFLGIWQCVGVGSSAAAVNPQALGEGEISLPHSRAIFSKLKNEDKDLFPFRNCKKWCKKAQNAIISLSFPSYVNWQSPENRLCRGEGGRQKVAWRGLGSPQVVVYEWIRLSIVLPYADHLFSMTQTLLPLFCSNAAQEIGDVFINLRGFINPIRRLGVKLLQTALPAALITLTLFSASPRLIFNFFVWTPLASYGTIRQKESWTPMASHAGDRITFFIALWWWWSKKWCLKLEESIRK